MSNCIFCKIAAGELPANKVYEDEYVVAFLDIAPITRGHTLIIPKNHHESLTTVEPEVMQAMMSTAALIGKSLMRVLDYDGFNLHLSNGQCAGQIVPHCHLHVVPRIGTDGFSWGWRSLDYKEGEAEEIAEKIINKLEKHAAG